VILWTACVTIALLGVTIKLIHGSAIETHQIAAGKIQGEATLLSEPPDTLAVNDYMVLNGFSRETQGPYLDVSIPLQSDRNFGKTGTTHVALGQTTTLVTQIKAFPWNSIIVNGRVVDENAVQLKNDLLSVRLPKGRYEIGYQFNANSTWLWLRQLSFGILALCFIAKVGLLARRLRYASVKC
jgi:hypothetical protein